MTYAEPLSNQVLMFIRSIGPGVLIGLIYDVIFTFFRTFSSKRPVIIAADLTFSIIATLISFFYMVIYNSGTVRMNIIIAEIIGAVAFHMTMGKYIAKPVSLIAKAVGKIAQTAFYPVLFICKKIKSLTKKLINNVDKKEKKEKKEPKITLQGKKIINIIKIHLKN